MRTPRVVADFQGSGVSPRRTNLAGRAVALFALSLVSLAPAVHAEPEAEDTAPERDHYVEARSYGTKRETEPPAYVRNLSETGLPGAEDVTWLDLGLDYRFRYEFRDDDLRRPTQVTDNPVLLRARAFLAIKEIADPLRFTIEVEDARRYNSQFAEDDRDVNEMEPIQAFGELHFEDGLGRGRPLALKGGRFAFEFLDRRLIARNEWRNTTNTFQGARVQLGQDRNDWNVELLALQPLERLLSDFDPAIDEAWFFGAITSWRRWSRVVTLQPYYLGLDQDQSARFAVAREIHTVGLRAYGPTGKTGFDYDVSGLYQFGENGVQDHRAWAVTVDFGYTFDAAWKPRVGVFYGYATGDEDPTDQESNRFERLFGFARPWSSNDYVQMENVNTPKVVVAFEPLKNLKIDTAYVAYWLASATDRWNSVNLRDPTGRSGTFMGQEYNIRARCPIVSRVQSNVGYAWFSPGEFPSNLGKGRDSHFVYVELSIDVFE